MWRCYYRSYWWVKVMWHCLFGILLPELDILFLCWQPPVTGRLKSQSCDLVWKVIITAELFSCCFCSTGKVKRNNDNNIRLNHSNCLQHAICIFKETLLWGSLGERSLFAYKWKRKCVMLEVTSVLFSQQWAAVGKIRGHGLHLAFIEKRKYQRGYLEAK